MTKPVDSADFNFGIDAVGRRERRPVAIHGHVATDDGRTGEALILDISHDGCGIETPVRLIAGQSIMLTVSHRPPIPADVCWATDGKAGLVFGKDPPAEEQEQPREDDRVKLRVEANMRRLGRGSYRVNVFDVSPQGCKVELVERPSIGEHVLLRFDTMEAIDAEVCWVEGYSAGLRFERPIHAAVFELMVQRLSR